MAVALSPKDLLRRNNPYDVGRPRGIPKLFHQSWKNKHLPAKFAQWSRTCREQHPGWEWVLWTDEDNRGLIEARYPWLEETYNRLPGKIYRVDMMRNLYMHAFGGVYADLDTDCLRPTEDMLDVYGIDRVGEHQTLNTQLAAPESSTAVFGRMGSDFNFEHHLPNAWMASTPGHPFFLLPIESIKAEVDRSQRPLAGYWYDWPSAEQMTGPIALRESIIQYAARQKDGSSSNGVPERIVLLPQQWAYPFNWDSDEATRALCSAEQDTFNASSCKNKLDVARQGSMSITYWSHTHRGKGVDKDNIAKMNAVG
ncbi:uncharacterized protein B0I36DRAFT_252631 [Microdochium trichocladiopsis]|uniref:Uncharacterized protein n=1 Tax=Microdochium trichocladiopsis TaxID=1682393 RepID=A0A9P9BNC9_9PEZI|nr:uncharacterized protein B0I36DRAFT_252631 [Microdochium trichocladiopsis]KAH7020758.1 hypothetical protein B0I36DRAFT_252631 [Microdochium trichocladiopsis]